MGDIAFSDCESPFQLLFQPGLRRVAVSIFAAELAMAIFGSISPLIQRSLIDSATIGNRGYTIFFAVLLGAVLFLLALGRSTGRWLRGRLAVNIRSRIKSALFHHLLNLPKDFLQNRGPGYFFNRMQSDAGVIEVFLSGTGILLFTDSVKILLAGGMIAFMHWQLAIFVLPFLFLQLVVCFYFRKRQYRLSRKLQECIATERHTMLDFLNNHCTLKVHGAIRSAEERIDSGLNRWSSLSQNRIRNESVFQFLLQFPVWFCCGGMTLFGLWRVLEHQWTLGELWALLNLTLLVFTPARGLGGSWLQMQTAMAAWKRLRDLLAVQPEPNAFCAQSDMRLTGDIVFRDVCFSYTVGVPVLENFNLCVKHNTILFLTGANGSGKSTILSLLLRLANPQCGEISIGGVSISQMELGAYRSRIGYIGQRPEFIQGTIRENLLLGIDYSDSEIIAKFRQLGCDELIEARPDGLSALVAECGDNFSGGERLRLALVRELLRNTDILLFDEPAANLDYAGKKAFYNLLPIVSKAKTVIAVVHEIPDDLIGTCVVGI